MRTAEYNNITERAIALATAALRSVGHIEAWDPHDWVSGFSFVCRRCGAKFAMYKTTHPMESFHRWRVISSTIGFSVEISRISPHDSGLDRSIGWDRSKNEYICSKLKALL